MKNRIFGKSHRISTKERFLVIGVILIVSIISPFFFGTPNPNIEIKSQASNGRGDFFQANFECSNSYTEHSPISIDGNVDFLNQATNEGWSGTGALGDPIVITGYNITNSSGILLQIRNTNLYFQLSNNLFDGGWGSHEIGLFFENVSHGTIDHNIITKMQGRLGQDFLDDGGPVTGVCMFNTTMLTFANNIVSEIYGGDSGEGGSIDINMGDGGTATGINITHSRTLTFTNNAIQTVYGGVGSSSRDGGNGGDARGICMFNTTMLTFTNNIVSGIKAQNGSEGPGAYGGSGGNGTGISLEEIIDGTLVNNTLFSIIGGQRGKGHSGNGRDGNCVGLLILNGRNITVKRNTFSNTNGKSLALSYVDTSTIKDNIIGNCTGQNGLHTRWGGTAGESLIAITVQNVNNNTFIGNTISNIRGGDGASQTGYGGAGNGGTAIGFSIVDAFNNVISWNSVNTIVGGNGGNGFDYRGTGGDGIGIALINTINNTLSNNSISNCIGGIGGNNKVNGTGIPIFTSNSQDNIITTTSITSISITSTSITFTSLLMALAISGFLTYKIRKRRHIKNH
ncbi:MAG: hypothetical protein ACFFBD_00970 [Candidatus Hodarchaeota archaeon]